MPASRFRSVRVRVPPPVLRGCFTLANWYGEFFWFFWATGGGRGFSMPTGGIAAGTAQRAQGRQGRSGRAIIAPKFHSQKSHLLPFRREVSITGISCCMVTNERRVFF